MSKDRKELYRKLLNRVKGYCKPFNTYTIKGFRQSQIENLPKYLESMWKDVVDVINRYSSIKVEYLGYYIIPPLQRIQFELTKKRNIISVVPCFIYLVGFYFKIGEETHEILVFLPYMDEYHINVHGAKYFFYYSINDKLFFRIRHGINTKLRMPLEFYGYRMVYTVKDIDGNLYYDTIVLAKIHYKSKSNTKTSIMHYLLAKFGLQTILKKYHLQDKIQFVEEVDDNRYEWIFVPIKTKSKIAYCKFHRSILENYLQKRVLFHILYCLPEKEFEIFELQDNELSKSVFKYSLGKLIYGSKMNKRLIIHQIKTHLDTLESYIDSLAYSRFKILGINNIFEFLEFVFNHFEQIAICLNSNEVFKRRITYAEPILEIFIRPIYKTLFNFINNESRHDIKSIKNLLNMGTFSYVELYSIENKCEISSNFFNNNFTMALLRANDSFKHKKEGLSLLTAPVYKFHVSLPHFRCVNYFSTNKPERNNLLNPYAILDELGNIHPIPILASRLHKQFTYDKCSKLNFELKKK